MATSGARRALVLMSMLALSAVGGGVALAATRSAGSGPPVRYGVDIQATYTASGQPALVANFTFGGPVIQWSICRPPDVTVCAPERTRNGFPQPGPTPAGTIFEATARYKGKLYAARSAVWLGQVHATAPPRLNGRSRYGATVSATPGSWSGGWQPDPSYRPPDSDFSGGRGPSIDLVNIEACATKTARHCVNLSPPGRRTFYSNRPVTIDSAITGFYLFAFDVHYSPDTAFASPGYTIAAAIPVVHAGQMADHSPAAGPITGPPRPSVAIIKTARIRRGRLPIARIRCAVPCRVIGSITGTHEGASVRRTLRGATTLSIPWKGSYGRQLDVLLFVGEGPAVTGTTRLLSTRS